MKAIITEEYTCYGGDHNRILYLDRGITGNVQLCLQAGWGSAGVVHLTSTDDNYQDWLYKHCSSLLLIGKEHWYKDPECLAKDYYAEFYHILKKLVKATGYTENSI